MRKVSKHAFTLIEVIIVCALFILIFESVYAALFIGQKSWSNYSNIVLLKQNVRRAVILMSNELREAKNIFITKDKHFITLSFDRPILGSISYKWSDIGENAYQIIRKNYDHVRILATGISFLSFDFPIDNQLIIDVAAGKEKQFNLKEKIALRSKISFLTHY